MVHREPLHWGLLPRSLDDVAASSVSASTRPLQEVDVLVHTSRDTGSCPGSSQTLGSSPRFQVQAPLSTSGHPRLAGLLG